MKSRHFALLAACAGVISLAPLARGAVIINEFLYDDGSTDDREYVELHNNGAAAVDISGWTVGGQDATAANTTTTIPAGTSIPAGGYYVIGQTGVQNVNQVVGSIYENDAETLELRNGAGGGNVLQDAVVYEANKGAASHGALPADVVSNVGPGFWGNHQAVDLAGPGATKIGSSAVGRYLDGRDTDNNGRDFGMRASTPGASNNPNGSITSYAPPNVSGLAPGTSLPNFAYSFVAPRVIDPTVVDANNPNAIAAPPGGGNAIVAWDSSGGGNGVSSFETFTTGQSAFELKAYFDTRDLPLMSNSTGVNFRGSEVTVYGIGGGDALTNLTNISGLTNYTTNDNGFTGVAWVYEKVGETASGSGDVSEKLYLVDANDGNPSDWTILGTVDLSLLSSDWHDLGISVDAAGNGTAFFDSQVFNFTTAANLVGAFNVGYRENTQLGADGTPDAILRPATFVAVPEPASLALVGVAGLALSRRRRSSR